MSDMTAIKFFVCPVCGNVVCGMGNVQLDCHGHHLEPHEAKSPKGRFEYRVEMVEDEYFVAVNHEMTKQDHIAFMAAVSPERIQLVRLFPEGPAEARFAKSMVRDIYFFSVQDGLFKFSPR